MLTRWTVEVFCILLVAYAHTSKQASDIFDVNEMLFCHFILGLFALNQHHITLDHNISIKIEKEVNDFLDDLYGDVSESE